MSDRLYVGTRKGLFTFERTSERWEIARVDFLGEPATMFLQDPRDGKLYVALTLGHFGVKLHRSSDLGASWTECGVPVFPQGAEFGTGPFVPEGASKTKPASLSEIWSLETGGPEEPDLLWAGTIPGGLFRSHDFGASWQLVDSLWDREERMEWFGGGKDDPGIHSICVDPRDSRHVAVGISCGGVWVTRDGGTSWNCQGDGLRAEFMPPNLADNPNIQDAHRLAQSAADPDVMWIQHHNGIFHSVDGAESWTEIKTAEPSSFGFATCAHPHDAQTAWFVPGVKDECRVPVDAELVVTRTTDGGKSFEILREGLPQRHCYDIVFRHGLDVDATGARLVMGSSTGGLWISEDSGDSWATVSNLLPQIYCVRFERAVSDA
jgi:hypothetical protein